MRRFFALSLATSLLGGCSCKGTPAPPASTTDTVVVVSPRQAPPQPVPPAPAPPKEPTAYDKAVQFHQQGRLSGESGNLQEALNHFQQARELAPGWPLPIYDTALTYLLMGDTAKALTFYEQVDKLEPKGFADTKRVLECLRREKSGRVPKGTFRKFIDLMRLRDPEAYERQLAEMTKAAPNFYPAWREFIVYGKDLDEQERRLEKALSLKPDAESRGELLVYKSNLLRRRGKEAEARELLQSLVDDPQSLPSTVTSAKEALTFTLPP
ncbi:MAG TPA: tetratricopeptide repeat protein [Archangium sp.]|jgi:tetratricopeptide (TPR) repeat protein|uniref:tetratricopeptide repeat protein n=1 Tax=Archangium sp. TaxID=1872627 RepID=UPI002ED83606